MRRLVPTLIFLCAPAWADVVLFEDPVHRFWNHLDALCGQAFEGQLIDHPEGETDFVGQRLVMHVRDCHRDWIRIPFQVGDDRSRTWVITRDEGRIRLRHVHRHEDGTPDEVSMYGGLATNRGQATVQYFPADEQTRQVIEAAFSNVWMIGIEPGQTFTYGLRRLGTPRVFRIDFDLQRPIDPPPPPWGWVD
jgi:hypothetical protein